MSLADTLESVETAAMYIKLCVRAGDLATARRWHGKLESAVQRLYNDEKLYPEKDPERCTCDLRGTCKVCQANIP